MLEQTLEAALLDARLALTVAEGERADLETRVEDLRTEVAGLEAALVRRHLTQSSASDAPIAALIYRQPTTGAIHASGSVLPPIDSPIAGVATLVIMLIQLHHDWTSKKRASAVELVLRSAQIPLHRGAITETLQRVGRPKDNLRDVSAALAYLHRMDRVKPIGDGIWVHTDFASRYVD
jgi:hypothetical protein